MSKLTRRRFLPAILLLAFGTPALAQPRTIAGPVTKVRDGDTIELAGLPIRLNGLHAPELHQPGGVLAREWMITHTRGQRITCTLNGERNKDRVVGVCRNAAGDLAAQLIAAGLGRDCAYYSGGRYRRYETPAAAAMPLPPYCTQR
jgi:endonuclease YncB( thermonuclease family)